MGLLPLPRRPVAAGRWAAGPRAARKRRTEAAVQWAPPTLVVHRLSVATWAEAWESAGRESASVPPRPAPPASQAPRSNPRALPHGRSEAWPVEAPHRRQQVREGTGWPVQQRRGPRSAGPRPQLSPPSNPGPHPQPSGSSRSWGRTLRHRRPRDRTPGRTWADPPLTVYKRNISLRLSRLSGAPGCPSRAYPRSMCY